MGAININKRVDAFIFPQSNMQTCIGRIIQGTPTPSNPDGPGLDTLQPRGVRVTKAWDLLPGEHVAGSGYVNIVRPTKGSYSSMCCIYVHGGGFVESSPETSYRPFTMKLAKLMRMPLYVPDYSLAPESKYPTQVNQILGLAQRLSKTYKQIVLMGDSAGGTIALTAALIDPKLFARCIFLSPWVNLESLSVNYAARASPSPNVTGCTDPVFVGTAKQLSRQYVEGALEYLGRTSLLNSAPSNPARASSRMLRALPPSLFLVGDREALRAEVLAFAGRAQLVNPHITVQLYDGMWHDWPMYADGCGGRPVSLAVEAQRSIAQYARTGKDTEHVSLTARTTVYLTRPEGTRRLPSRPSQKQRSRVRQSQGARRSRATKRKRRKN
jgi:acetyl esterase/lipase